jgi:hypothetical protein
MSSTTSSGSAIHAAAGKWTISKQMIDS